ncbi:hypothetical protein [Moraxella lacunata]
MGAVRILPKFGAGCDNNQINQSFFITTTFIIKLPAKLVFRSP